MLNSIDKFNEDHAEALKRFLAAPQRPEGTMSYLTLAGFLFAVSNAPEMIQPSGWLPVVFGDHEPEYGSHKELKEIMAALLSLYNFTSRGDDEGEVKLPPGCRILEDPMDNFGPQAPLGQWAAGFNHGRLWLEESWNAVLDDELEEEFNLYVINLIFFADRGWSEEFYQDARNDNESKVAESFEEFAAGILSVFPKAMKNYADLGRGIFKALMKLGLYEKAFDDGTAGDPGWAAAPGSGAPGPGRNDPCPCGSGRKFKKCCLH